MNPSQTKGKLDISSIKLNSYWRSRFAGRIFIKVLHVSDRVGTVAFEDANGTFYGPILKAGDFLALYIPLNRLETLILFGEYRSEDS